MAVTGHPVWISREKIWQGKQFSSFSLTKDFWNLIRANTHHDLPGGLHFSLLLNHWLLQVVWFHVYPFLDWALPPRASHGMLALVTHQAYICGTGWDISSSSSCPFTNIPPKSKGSGSNVHFFLLQHQTNIAMELALIIRIVGSTKSLSTSSFNFYIFNFSIEIFLEFVKTVHKIGTKSTELKRLDFSLCVS